MGVGEAAALARQTVDSGEHRRGVLVAQRFENLFGDLGGDRPEQVSHRAGFEFLAEARDRLIERRERVANAAVARKGDRHERVGVGGLADRVQDRAFAFDGHGDRPVAGQRVRAPRFHVAALHGIGVAVDEDQGYVQVVAAAQVGDDGDQSLGIEMARTHVDGDGQAARPSGPIPCLVQEHEPERLEERGVRGRVGREVGRAVRAAERRDRHALARDERPGCHLGRELPVEPPRLAVVLTGPPPEEMEAALARLDDLTEGSDEEELRTFLSELLPEARFERLSPRIGV